MIMKAKNILTALLIFGFTSSCGKSVVDYKSIVGHTYINQTEHSITIEGHLENPDINCYDLTWNIATHKQLDLEFNLMTEMEISPQICDYIIIVFDGQRKLKVQHGELCLSQDNVIYKSKRHKIYYHYITDDMYQMAIDI